MNGNSIPTRKRLSPCCLREQQAFPDLVDPRRGCSESGPGTDYALFWSCPWERPINSTDTTGALRN